MPGRPVVIFGEMYDPTLGIWGGPYPPQPGQPPGGGQPPGIWGGGNQPFPTPPIANVPGLPPTQNPPGWGLRPEHPIYYPPGIWGPPGPWPTPPIAGIPGLPGYNPPGIWGGGNVPMPNPPIANVPGAPGYQPPGIWGPPGPWPTPPIYIPIQPPGGGGGGQGGDISHPINEPPTDNPYWQQVYVPQMGGWVWAIVPPPGWQPPGQGQPPSGGSGEGSGEEGSSPSR